MSLFSCASDLKDERDIIEIPDSLRNNLEIQTVKLMPVWHELKVKTSFVPENIVKIYAPVNGSFQKVNVIPGNFVKQGDTLARMYASSASTVNLKKALLNAQSSYSIAEQNLHAINEMRRSGHYTQKKYNAAVLEQKRAETELYRLKNELVKIKRNSELKAKYILTAPIAGYIVESGIGDGREINNPLLQSIFSIAAVKDISLISEFDNKSEKELKEGSVINFKSESWPGCVCAGKITFEKIKGKDKSKLMIRLLNPELCTGLSLPPELTLNYIDNNRKELAVPTKAVLSDNEKQFVIIYSGENIYSKRAICIIEKTSDLYYVDCGINEGEKIIANGQQALLFLNKK